MNIDKNNPESTWISYILRLAIGLLMVLAGLGKIMGGLAGYEASVSGMFKDTFLPGFLLVPYIKALPFAELLAGVWILSGYKLRAGWVFTSLILVSLGFGLSVAKQSSADVYTFLLIACVGLYFSKYDGCYLGCCGKKK